MKLPQDLTERKVILNEKNEKTWEYDRNAIRKGKGQLELWLRKAGQKMCKKTVIQLRRYKVQIRTEI